MSRFRARNSGASSTHSWESPAEPAQSERVRADRLHNAGEMRGKAANLFGFVIARPKAIPYNADKAVISSGPVLARRAEEEPSWR
jgi:hypothetical protein